jgi:phosphopantetheinyl transferase
MTTAFASNQPDLSPETESPALPVEIYYLNLAGGGGAESWGILSADEQKRAGRFRFERDQRRYIAGRAFLRNILGGALGRAPVDLVFQYTPAGKPFLGESGLHFNISHSADRFLCAVGRGAEVGVDLERLVAIPEMTGVGEKCFSPAEQVELRRAPEAARIETFYRLWTRKEAAVKCRGVGLGGALTEGGAGLFFEDLHPEIGFCAAVASVRPFQSVQVRGEFSPTQAIS